MTFIFIILITHFIADFIMQDEKWATTKSTSVQSLTIHVGVYALAWIIPSWYLLSYNWVWFVLTTFIFHWFTDFFTSKIVKKKFDNKHYGSPVPNLGAFTVIGFDQLLHYSQLFITYNILKSWP